MTDYWFTYESDYDLKRKKELTEYFSKKNKFISKDPYNTKKIILSTNRKIGENTSTTFWSYSNPLSYSINKSINVKTLHKELDRNDVYGKKILILCRNSRLSWI